jgi:hypothetical protein
VACKKGETYLHIYCLLNLTSCQDTGRARENAVVPKAFPDFSSVHPLPARLRTNGATSTASYAPMLQKKNNFIFIFTYSYRLPKESQILSFFPTLVRFQKLTRNLFLTLHGHNVHRQQWQLSKVLMCYQQFASHAYCGASFQDGVTAGKDFLCAPF